MVPISDSDDSELPPPESDFEEQIVQEVPIGEVTLPLPTEPAEERLARLHAKARALEQIPGVYLLKDTRDVVIYVGKSRSLRDRVSSYFLSSTDLGPVKQRLLDYVADFDTLTCDSEVEALLIESRLIKDLHPRFNARLSDGKSYPYLEITTREDFPGVYVTRKPQTSGTKLYGPFISGYALKQALIYMQRAFK
ncbi:MAG: excinuclease ABC subunit UvrC, partial [Phycisphaerae bacterium]